MGCKDGWASTGVIVKVTFILVFVSMFCNWLAFCTNSWTRVDGGTHDGLWRSCRTVTSDLLCGPLDGTDSTKMGVVQAFGIVGFMCQNVGFFLIVLFMFRNNYKGNSEIRLASAVLLIISAVGWLISVAIYGDMANTNLHYSYALAVCACGLGLVGGILMIFGSRGDGHAAVSSK